MRAIAARPTGLQDPGDVVAFTAVPGVVVRHPVWLAWVTAAALTLGWVVLAGWGVLRGGWTWPGVTGGSVAAIPVWSAAVAVPAVIWALCTTVFPWLSVFHSGTHGAWLLYLGWALAVPAVVWGVSAWRRRGSASRRCTSGRWR